ncbi:LysR family transcriptional regulator [Citrobacter portucalensis]|nr:LysR family transcriptional regulator [Citrobacter portucalensis]MDE9666241.1 LysR family transcriptional regulator [Citrobacter portucalensis]MDE9676060.1 LysR family transcriptional regulator [Citrobacter portucalensis]
MKNKSFGQVTDFDLKLLRIFKTVAECGSFSAAESLLGITRSAVSMHMSDLEKRLGMRLCQRGRAGFSLTDEGREILRLSDTMMAAIETFRQQVNQMHRHLRGEFNVGIINNLVTQPMMRITNALDMLREKGPDVRINLSMCTAADIERGLMDGRLHVGALPLTSPVSGLDYMHLYDEKSNLYCSSRHPLFHSDGEPDNARLSRLDAVVPSYRMTAESIGMHQLLECSATASDREGIAFLILTGRFVGFLPDHYATHWVDKGMMRVIAPDRLSFSTRIAIVTRKASRPNSILELFLDSLSKQ